MLRVRDLMTDLPDPQMLARRTIELLGGVDRAKGIFDIEFGEMKRRWDQDTNLIGRILRAHLYVEYYMTEYLDKANPRLGNLSKSRITFSQKLHLLDKNDKSIRYVVLGIKQLNSIRNRIAHNLQAGVTEDDARIFLAAAPIEELKSQLEETGNVDIEPIEALESFSTYAAHALSHQFSEFGSAFTQALNETSSDSNF